MHGGAPTRACARSKPAVCRPQPASAWPGCAGRGGAFTSDLSASEFALVRQAGFRPLAQVMGSCFYRLGDQYKPGTRRPGVYTPEGVELRRRLRERLLAGVRVRPDRPQASTAAPPSARSSSSTSTPRPGRKRGGARSDGWPRRQASWARTQSSAYGSGAGRTAGAAGLIEFVVVGTAVASERYDLGGRPVLSNLSGQEFAGLLRSRLVAGRGSWPRRR